MPNNLSLEQYQEIFNKLPKERQDLILSEETAKSVFDACMASDIDVDKIPEVAKYVGYVLANIIKEGDFVDALVKEVGLERKIALQIDEDLTRWLFSKPTVPKTEDRVEKMEEMETVVEEREIPRRQDTYRESIE